MTVLLATAAPLVASLLLALRDAWTPRRRRLPWLRPSSAYPRRPGGGIAPDDAVAPCSADASCDPGYECREVGPDDRVTVNRRRLAPGRWCLPSEMPPCHPQAGALVWTRDGGGWQCRCLYPDVLSGPACDAPSACDGRGTLVHAETGEPWDEKGNPYVLPLECRCDPDRGVALEGDPLRCHADPCYAPSSPREGGRPVLFDDGACRCDRLEWIESNVDGKCRPPPEHCLWDPHDKLCHCGQGLDAVFCQSESFARSPSITETCPANTAGCVCKPACPPCQNGGVVEKKLVEPGRYACSCQCPTQGNLRFFGDACEKSCFVRGTEVPADQVDLCCSQRASHWCVNPPLCSDYANVCR